MDLGSGEGDKELTGDVGKFICLQYVWLHSINLTNITYNYCVCHSYKYIGIYY